MKVGDRDLKFLRGPLYLLSPSFGFTTDNEFECKQLQVLQCCNSACLSVSVSTWDYMSLTCRIAWLCLCYYCLFRPI